MAFILSRTSVSKTLCCLALLGCVALTGCVPGFGDMSRERGFNERGHGTVVQQDSAQRTYSALLRAAVANQQSGKLIEAIRLYRRAHMMQPTETLPLIQIGFLHMAQKSYAQSLGAFEKALALEPENPAILRGLGNLRLTLGQPEDAIPLLRQAIAIEPGNLPALNSLGVAHDMLGQHKLAHDVYRMALERQPAEPRIQTNYALSLVLDDQIASGLGMLSNSEDDGPADLRQTQALIYALAGDEPTAQSILTQIFPTDEAAKEMAFFQELRTLPESKDVIWALYERDEFGQ